MLTQLLFSHLPGVRVDRVWRDDDVVHLDAVTTRRAAHCPLCGRRSKRVHSHYARTLTDLPCCGDPLVIHLRTRRFACRVRWCKRKIFTERIPALVAPSARRTVRLHRHLERTGLRQAACTASTAEESTPIRTPDSRADEPVTAPPLSRWQREQQECRGRRYARYEEVCALRAQGHSIGAIAQRMDISPRTVQRFLHAETFPERAPRRCGPTLLTPFEPFLRERWSAGCHNATQLWRELRARGFTGRYGIVALHLHRWRAPERRDASRSVRTITAYSPRQTVWLLLRSTEKLTADECAYLLRLQQGCPEVMVAQALVEEFAAALKEHDVARLYAWLHRAEECGIAELRAAARGMWIDRPAVEATVVTEWSNGQTEGRVNRLKVLKRSMYGRGKFDLLRQRMLYTG